MLEHIFDDEEEENPYDYLSSLGETQIPEVEMQTPALNKFMSFMENVPKRENFAPKFKDRILPALVAGLGGAAEGMQYGVNLGQKMLDRPYDRAVEDFQIQAKAMEPAVKAEASTAEFKRKSIKDMLQKANADRRFLLDMKRAETIHADKIKAIDTFEKKHGETERSKQRRYEADRELKEYMFKETLKRRDAQIGLNRRGVEVAEAREKRASKDDDYIKANEQRYIEREAAKSIKNDPRFSKWYRFNDKTEEYEFVTKIEDRKGNVEEMDDITKNALYNALAQAKKRVATMKRSSYEDVERQPFDWNLYEEEDEDETMNLLMSPPRE